MKRVLPETLHARPANLLVRVAKQHHARIEVVTESGRADAKSIVAVLGLGAREGESLELLAEGPDADAALLALGALIDGAFDRDLVPETGQAAVEGLAIGVAILAGGDDTPDVPLDARRDALAAAFARAIADLDALVASLPRAEAALFEPERAILAEVEQLVVARVAAGASVREAIVEATAKGGSDLLLDARGRLLAALSGRDVGAVIERIERAGGETIVVAEGLTPSLVAALPASVVGIAAVDPEHAGTSHAAILARGRGLPLVWIPPHVAASIGDGDRLVLDTTTAPARLWIDPAPALVDDARARQRKLEASRASDAHLAEAPLTALGVAVRINVGSLGDAIPAGAEGVGLLRTELLFAERAHAPTEAEQRSALEALVARVQPRPFVVRLFDAGGDKPLSWLAPRASAPDARGVALLLAHPAILDAQLAAIAAIAVTERAGRDVRVLLPFAHHPDELAVVRRKLGSALAVGAMIETVAAVGAVDALAAASDFLCIGTNDLAASTLGTARGAAEAALDPRVLRHVERIVVAARAHGRGVTVCGEIAADPAGARILVGLGVEALSVAPPAWAPLKLDLARASRADCERAARAALR